MASSLAPFRSTETPIFCLGDIVWVDLAWNHNHLSYHCPYLDDSH